MKFIFNMYLTSVSAAPSMTLLHLSRLQSPLNRCAGHGSKECRGGGEALSVVEAGGEGVAGDDLPKLRMELAGPANILRPAAQVRSSGEGLVNRHPSAGHPGR